MNEVWILLNRFGIKDGVDFLFAIMKYSITIGLFSGIGTLFLTRMQKRWERSNQEFEVRLKNQLDRLNKEHEVVFTKYHEKQSIVLAEYFSKMSVMERSIKYCLGVAASENNEGMGETLETAKKVIIECVGYYNDNEIYFSSEIRSHVESTRNAIESIFNVAERYILNMIDMDSETSLTEKQLGKYLDLRDKVGELLNKSHEVFPKLRQELRKEIRIILQGKAE